jgi:hypothetical protein
MTCCDCHQEYPDWYDLTLCECGGEIGQPESEELELCEESD